MDILKSLNDAVDYIEKHLCEDVDIGKAAQISAMSEYDFSNLFHSLTSMTVREYIRKRRLTLAGEDLQHGKEKVIEIALKYGYDSADSFRRAFVLQHNITPSQARSNKSALKIYPPVSFHINIMGAEKMDFKIIDAEEMTVYGISRDCFSSEENRYELARTMWSDECDNIPKSICDGYDGKWYGVWYSNKYLIGREKDDCRLDILESLEKDIIPSGKYAVFTTELGGYAGDELPKLHKLIFDAWLPNSKFVQNGNIEIEVYHLCTDRAERRKKRYYEIWIPVREKFAFDDNSKPIIRNAKPQDCTEIKEICQNELGYKCTKELVSSKLRQLDTKREQVFTAEYDGKCIGFVHIEKYDVLYCEAGANILGLAVSSDYQGLGIGKMLMEKAEKWAKDSGARWVRLNSGAERKEAHKFYRHSGFDNEKEQIRFLKKI
ncbi:MAG: GNAT family N-acetyltransferase [Eubacterium sp.]